MLILSEDRLGVQLRANRLGWLLAERRGRGEDAVYYDHMGTPCRDSRCHRSCSGRWRAEVSLGKDGAGKRIRRKISAKTKTEAYAKLNELRDELALGVPRGFRREFAFSR
jgi:hypothetical protein